ncbi:LysR family transcriptional regulator [Thalassotalea ganghwensis]
MSLDNLHYFVAVVEQGSLTKAANHLSIPKSKLSRRLAQLEQHLGSQLMIRTTRKLVLTESGRLLHQSVKPHIDALNSASELVGNFQGYPRGQLKVLLPLEFFSQLFTELIAKFAKNFAEIEIICHHYSQAIPEEDSNYDLIFILHEQPLNHASWIGKNLLSFPQSLYAGNLFNLASISSVKQLEEVNCVQSSPGKPWFFRAGNTIEAIYVKERIVLTSPEMRLSAVKENLGVGVFPDYLVSNHRHQLQRLNIGSAPVAQQLSVLYQSRSIPQKTRVFLDFVQSHIGTLS